MPTVPRYTQQVSPAPLPGARKTAAESALSTGAGLEQARAEKFGALADVGAAVGQVGGVMAQEAARLAEEAKNTRETHLDRQFSEFRLTRLHDPATGAFATVKGVDALALDDSVTKAFDELATQLELGLSERQKVGFYRIRDRQRLALGIEIADYAGKEMATYTQQERVASLTRSQELAVRNFDNPYLLGEELGRQREIIAGWPGLGPEARALALEETLTATHAAVITSYLARGQDRIAQVYYEEAREQISGGKRAAIEHQLETATTAGNGLRAAAEIWEQLGPKGDADPIELDKMEDVARARFANDTKTLEKTIGYLRERKQGVDAARQDRREATAGTLWRAVNAGVPLRQIRTMPAYLDAPGALQLDVSKHIEAAAEQRADRSYALGERARAAAARLEAEKEQAGWASMWHYDRPEILSRMSDNQVLALTPTIGIDHVNRLMEKKRKYATAASEVQAATIDEALFDSIAESAGLHPFKPSLSETEKATLGQTKHAALSAIDLAQQQKKGPLSRAEKETLMHSIVDRKVMLDRWGDVSLPAAAVVNAKDREAAYVPLAEIPESSLNEWVNVLRRLFPSNQGFSRQDLITAYRDRIQRAHAAAVLGLGEAEETRRLEGR